MSFSDGFTILQTPDIGRLSGFYVERLGFAAGYRWPETGEPAFLVVGLGAFSLGLARAEPPGPPGRVAVWLYADDVDRAVEDLRRHGVPVVAEPADTEWGERMATVSDPDGNAVHLGQRAP